MKGGRWSVLQLVLINGAVEFHPALIFLDGGDTPRPAHGALRHHPGIAQHAHPAGALTTQRDGPKQVLSLRLSLLAYLVQNYKY